jgi:hypothetical protein
MPWNISFLPDLDAVFTEYYGEMPPDELYEAVQTTIQLSQDHGTTRFLADCSALQGGHSIVDLYDLASLVDNIRGTMHLEEAIVLPQLDAAASEVRFWETTGRNRGLNIRIFHTMEEARDWLDELRGK